MPAPYSVQKDTTGLGWGYRLRWSAAYTAMSIFGPANRQPEIDPRHQMRRERARLLLDNYRAAGQEPPEELHRIAQRGR